MNQTQEIRTAAIIGAGPAGSSLAIRLANMGIAVTLIERERFPRDKLCGEFISPECRTHFAELGIEDRIATYGGREIGETRFTAINGRTVMVPSEWFGSNNALSLSRAAMDEVMLRRAYELGVETLEGWSATRAEILNGRIDSLMIRSQTGETRTLSADIFIDAAGRSGILERLCDSGRTKGARAEIVAFKAHFSGIASLAGRCEIFSFPEGYGGLSPIDNGRSNLCFMVRSRAARHFRGDVERILSDLVKQNARARTLLSGSERISRWHSAAIGAFGRRRALPAKNAAAAGDAAAFIDPFTGSGMLMALESARLFSDRVATSVSAEDAVKAYLAAHRQYFRRRLITSALLRRAAFDVRWAMLAVRALSASEGLRRCIARLTRPLFDEA